MPVAEVDGLLYLPGHERQDLLRALRIPALSPGWQASFRALLDQDPGAGNAGLAASSPPPAWAGFRPLDVAAITHESDSVISIRLEAPDGAPVPAAQPRPVPDAAGAPRWSGSASLLRNYSLSGPPGARLLPRQRQARAARRRKRIPLDEAVGRRSASTSPPRAARSSWTGRTRRCCSSARASVRPPCSPCSRPSRTRHSTREIWWLHSARNGREHPFAAEARDLLASLPNARSRIYYTRPGPDDVEGQGFDVAGRLTGSALAALEPPVDAQAYLCGPGPFMDEISAGLSSLGVDAARIHTEPFGPAARSDAGYRAGARAGAARAAGEGRRRSEDRVRAQRPRDPVERGLRQPARTRRGLRRSGPLVVQDRRLPDLRDDDHRRGRRVQPRPGGGAA